MRRRDREAHAAYIQSLADRDRRWAAYRRDGLTIRQVVMAEAHLLDCDDLIPASWRQTDA